MKLAGHTVNPRRLTPDSVVLDIGHGVGNFSRELLKLVDCAVTAYEPDPLSYNISRQSITHPKFRIHNKAVAASEGKRMFYSPKPGSCGNSLYNEHHAFKFNPEQPQNFEVETVSLATILKGIEKIDLVKMDVEGAELEILEATSIEDLRKIKQLSIEFHDFCFDNVQHRIEKAIIKLRQAGFLSVYWPDHSDPERDYYFYQPD